MHRILVLAFALLACSPDGQSSPATHDARIDSTGPSARDAQPVVEAHGVSVRLVRAIEQQVIMPADAQPLLNYNRLYVRRQHSNRDVVQGRFFLRDAPYVQLTGVPLDGIPNAYATTAQSLPIVMDGGCSVVTVFFDVATMKLLPLEQEGVDGEPSTGVAVCNGVA